MPALVLAEAPTDAGCIVMIFRMRLKTWAMRAVLCGVLSLAGTSDVVARRIVVSDEAATNDGLPADNPYAPAYAAMAGLGREDYDAIYAGKAPSAAALLALNEISRTLNAARPARDIDWGIDTSRANPDLKSVMPAFRITRLVVSSLEHVPAGERAERLLGVMAIGRHLGREELLITLSMQHAVDSRVYKWLEKNRGQLTPDEARRLLAGLSTLPKATTLPAALTTEKAVFIGGMLRDLKEAAELLSPQEDTGAAEGLRMTGIVVEGAATQIGFERGDVGFWLKRGQTRSGVTLTEVDPATDSALLKCDGRVLRLQLSSKRIAKIDLSRAAEAREKAPKNAVLAMLGEPESGLDGAAALRNLELVLTEIGQLYDEAREHPERFVDAETVKRKTAHLSELARGVAEMLPGFVQREADAVEREKKLRAMLEEIAGGEAGTIESVVPAS